MGGAGIETNGGREGRSKRKRKGRRVIIAAVPNQMPRVVTREVFAYVTRQAYSRLTVAQQRAFYV